MLKAEANIIPGQVKRIHLIAVCGTGMGALACMLKELGYEVTGSDADIYPPMSDFLRDKGIRVFKGFDPRHISREIDLVVVGNAVRRQNPEAVALADLQLPYCSMPQALNHFLGRRRQIMVSGTHGKTTTASLIAWILFRAGLEPSFFIGGIVGGFNSNFLLGRGKWLVLEGDEYDTAFFDKGPKFLHFRPQLTVITGIEFDHADIYADLEAVENAFRHLVQGLAPQATLLAGDSTASLEKIVGHAACRVERYGLGPAAFWRAAQMVQKGRRLEFSLLRAGSPVGEFSCPLLGKHNLENITAAAAAALNLGISPEAVRAALKDFPGVARRQQIRGEKNGILVMDDFAHHPTAVKATIEAVAAAFPRRRLIAVFEPRTNSSRRKVFQQAYGMSFDSADMVCVRRPPSAESIDPADRFSAGQLAADLAARGIDARSFPDTDAIIEFLVSRARPGDIILVMSNGGFDNIHSRLLDAL